jgi:two-component system KDP operon response regulator KdpE
MNPANESGEALVLLIEDDGQIRRVVRTTLESSGLQVRDAATAEHGLKMAEEARPHLVILDLGLPDADGIDVSRRLREWSDVPILVLSARSQEPDKVAALNAGADDYLTKPFGVNELLARVRALLRRAQSTGRPEHGQFSQGDLKVDFLKRLVTRHGQEVHLTPVEYKLLGTMIRGRGKVMTHRQLLREVWGGAHGEDAHYVRVYMAQLRRKLEDDPAQPKLLLTETGVGYRLADVVD